MTTEARNINRLTPLGVPQVNKTYNTEKDKKSDTDKPNTIKDDPNPKKLAKDVIREQVLQNSSEEDSNFLELPQKNKPSFSKKALMLIAALGIPFASTACSKTYRFKSPEAEKIYHSTTTDDSYERYHQVPNKGVETKIKDTINERIQRLEKLDSNFKSNKKKLKFKNIHEALNINFDQDSKGYIPGLTLINSDIDGSKLVNANIQGFTLFNSTLNAANLQGASLENGYIIGSSLSAEFNEKTNLDGLIIINSNLSNISKEEWEKVGSCSGMLIGNDVKLSSGSMEILVNKGATIVPITSKDRAPGSTDTSYKLFTELSDKKPKERIELEIAQAFGNETGIKVNSWGSEHPLTIGGAEEKLDNFYNDWTEFVESIAGKNRKLLDESYRKGESENQDLRFENKKVALSLKFDKDDKANVEGLSFVKSDLDGSEISNLQAPGSVFYECEMNGIDFENTDLSDSLFINCTVKGNFTNCNLEGAKFIGCEISDSRFAGSNLQSVLVGSNCNVDEKTSKTMSQQGASPLKIKSILDQDVGSPEDIEFLDIDAEFEKDNEAYEEEKSIKDQLEGKGIYIDNWEGDFTTITYN